MVRKHLIALFSRTLNHLTLLFGGVLLLALLLCYVAGEIRGAGESLFGRGYYYCVAPGVVCHEVGHVLGCFITGTEIEQVELFKPNGQTLGYVQYRYQKDGNLISNIRHLVIGTGPVWFGCLMIWLCVKVFARTVFLPKVSNVFIDNSYLSLKQYWIMVIKVAGRMVWNTILVWRWKSIFNIIYLYLVFCIASEMMLSWEDICSAWMGFVTLVGLFVILNLIPSIGNKVGLLIRKAVPFLFKIHVIMAFVLILAFALDVIFVLPLRIIF